MIREGYARVVVESSRQGEGRLKGGGQPKKAVLIFLTLGVGDLVGENP